jgi:hypothetical protein
MRHLTDIANVPNVGFAADVPPAPDFGGYRNSSEQSL